MTSRILPPEEYDRLIGTEAEAVIPHISKNDAARVVVVEDGPQIVGCHVLMPVMHAECLWIHPDHRGKASVGRRLWANVRRVLRDTFLTDSFITSAISDDVRGLLAHVGATKLETDQYVVTFGGQ